MKLPKVLLLYKNSSFANYFLGKKRISPELKRLYYSQELERFKKTHKTHYASIKTVEQILKKYHLSYDKYSRGERADYSAYDFIVTVGGDGTFLEASHNIDKQFILGVNSDPTWSVGRFCAANVHTFEMFLGEFLKGEAFVQVLNRMDLTFSTSKTVYRALNDVLITHQNPAAMSRYYLTVDSIKEEQRSSGVWVSTAVGSSGAILSAGGYVLPSQSKSLQYKPRELYAGTGAKYTLKGGIFAEGESLKIASLMREGVVYLDGSHICLPFSFGSVVTIKHSRFPLKALWK